MPRLNLPPSRVTTIPGGLPLCTQVWWTKTGEVKSCGIRDEDIDQAIPGQVTDSTQNESLIQWRLWDPGFCLEE